jgi:nucleoside-diphosphate-sugar epimerase
MAWDRLKTLGWEREVPFDRGIEETVAWFRDHPGRRGSGG